MVSGNVEKSRERLELASLLCRGLAGDTVAVQVGDLDVILAELGRLERFERDLIRSMRDASWDVVIDCSGGEK